MGNRTSRTDALSRQTRYGYDKDDELLAITYTAGDTPNVAFTYTDTGRRETMADGTGTSRYHYDLLDRVITSTTGAGQSVGYGYDANSNLTTLTYPDGNQVTRSYDAADRLTAVSDWLGHTTHVSYDNADNLTGQSYPNGTSAAFRYDQTNRLTGIVDSNGSGPFWTYSYERDGAGQLSSSSDPLDGGQHSYGYDTLTRLTSQQQTGGTASGPTGWAYNAAHDLTAITDTVQGTSSALGYDSANELTSLSTRAGSTPTQNLTLTYNDDGARTGQTDSVSGAASSYGYDQADRLVTATVGSSNAGYTYDGDGLRQSKTVNGSTTQQTWDVAEGLPLLVQDGSTRYVTGPDGLPLEQIAADGTVLYYAQDQLGSTRGLLDGAGNAVATYTYDPYGNLAGPTGSVSTPFGYAGQYTDAETGLQYLRSRYYDPATAQFLTRDPLLALTAQPYAYTTDNPLNATDPSGRCPWCIAAVVGAIVGGGIPLVSDLVQHRAVDWHQVAVGALAGGVTGATERHEVFAVQ